MGLAAAFPKTPPAWGSARISALRALPRSPRLALEMTRLIRNVQMLAGLRPLAPSFGDVMILLYSIRSVPSVFGHLWVSLSVLS